MSDTSVPLPGLNASALQESGEVIEQVELAHHTYRLRIACPLIADRILPGQFFMLRVPECSDPLLGRPFALYDVATDEAGRPIGVDFVYHVVGKLTALMSGWSGGEPVELWGPLGNGFPAAPAGRLLCVGGGIGYTPFLAVAREAVGQRSYGRPVRPAGNASAMLLYGVRSREMRASLADFADIPDFEFRIATDDGSEGHHGLVTDLLRQAVAEGAGAATSVYCCGPTPMLTATAALCEELHVACWVSLECPMACGFGACFSCVAKVRVEGEPGWDYRRTCVEGPVFPSSTLIFE